MSQLENPTEVFLWAFPQNGTVSFSKQQSKLVSTETDLSCWILLRKLVYSF